jgi:hypothetical protein
MLNLWLAHPSENKIPPFATHLVGVSELRSGRVLSHIKLACMHTCHPANLFGPCNHAESRRLLLLLKFVLCVGVKVAGFVLNKKMEVLMVKERRWVSEFTHTRRTPPLASLSQAL